MKGTDFKRIFPHYNQTKFILYEDNSEVDYVLGDTGLLLTVDNLFFKNLEYTKFLGINNQEQKYLQSHGIEKYKKWKHFDDFQQRYQKKLDKQTTPRQKKNWGQRTQDYWEKREAEQREKQEQTKLIEREWEKEWEAEREREADQKLAETQARERVTEGELAKLDLNKWQPRLWSGRGTVPESISLNSSPIEHDFPVYVNEFDSFPSQFQAPKTNWNAHSDNILTEKFDVDKDKYFRALGAAYVISYKAGFSKEHMEEKGIAGSLAKYAVYFHLKRFLTFPNLLNLSNVEKEEIQKKIPIKRIWARKFVDTKEIPVKWYDNQANKANIRKLKADYYADGGGQHGIYYDEVVKITNTNDQDWQKFIRGTGDGFTILGQKLLQQAIESFCYAILGAQAKTRWKIVGNDAKASQTQDVFRQLVRDTIFEMDSTKSISNMRTAIQDTNVVLNLVVSPGVSLLPSDMVLGKKIPGFNNILTVANKHMKFGKNEDVNTGKQKVEQQSVKPSPKPSEKPSPKPSPKPSEKPSEKPSPKQSPKQNIVEHPESNTTTYVILGVAISLLTKFIVYELL